MSIPKGPYLDIETPIVELAQRIEDLLKHSDVSSTDVKDLINKKEKLQKKLV